MRVESRLAAIQNDMRADRHFGDRYDELANLSTDLRHVSAQSNGKSEPLFANKSTIDKIFFYCVMVKSDLFQTKFE